MFQRETEEVQQLRESVAALTAQCAQLDEANRAWTTIPTITVG